MNKRLHLDSFRACSIPVVVLLALGNEVSANPTKWSVHDAENRDEPTNQIQWIDLHKQDPIEPDNKNTIIWKEVDESRQHNMSKEIIWEPLTEEESKFTDEQIEEGLPEVKVNPPLLYQTRLNTKLVQRSCHKLHIPTR